jgi:hypothetical protein
VIYSPLKDRKFWVVVMDGVVTIVTFGAGKYYPQSQEVVFLLLGFFQAVAAVLLAGYFGADAASARFGLLPPHLRSGKP